MLIANYKLKKDIGLFEAVMYGVGIILGAGIYSLIGVGAGVAGDALWLSFVIGAAIATFTGFSYAELASMYPKEAAEYVYTRHAFRRQMLSFIVEWIMLFAVIVSATTVALGFSGYWSFLFGGKLIVIAALLIIVMSLLNYFGIKDSARYNNVSTIIESLGLFAIILFGAYYLAKNHGFASIGYFNSPTGIGGILTATTLVYFAFIGFENLANLSEETKNAAKIIPKALLLSLGISSIIYILISIAAVGILGSENLANSKAPLSEVSEKAIPGSSMALSLIALFATSNTVLISLIVASRLFYGLASNRMLPKIFSAVGRHGTPGFSVFLVGALAVLSLLAGGIKDLAHLVDLGIFVVYIFVNLSLIVLRYKEPDARRPFKAPLNLGNFPLLAFFGLALNLGMLYFFELKVFIHALALSIVGVALYLSFSRIKMKKHHQQAS